MSILSSLISNFRTRREKERNVAVYNLVRSLQANNQTVTYQQPSTREEPQNDLLLQFFRGEENPLIPHQVEDIVVFTDEQKAYYEFLLRRRGRACIECRLWDESEKIFTKLLESPDSANYAHRELYHISKLRKEQTA